jgi:predicted transcriptional regulator
MASVDKQFLISALRSGFSESQIADALGVTQSAVSQVINAYNLREVAAKNSKFESIDTKLNSIEEAILTKLEKSVKFVEDPMKLTRILTAVNGAKRRSLAEGNSLPTDGARLVQLNLPERMTLTVNLNANNEVIGVNGRDLLTANPVKVLDAAREVNHELQRLPGPNRPEPPQTVADLL